MSTIKGAAGTKEGPAPKYTKKDFESDQDVRWCPGCGDYAILSAVQKIMPGLGIPKEDIVFVSGIGAQPVPYNAPTDSHHPRPGSPRRHRAQLRVGSEWLVVTAT